MMKTRASALRRATFFLAAIAVATCSLSAKDVSNKTYLSPRSPGVNLAQQYTTWHDHVYGKRCGKTHTSIQLTGFYSESGQSKELGKYFGIGNDSNAFEVGRGAEIEVDGLMHEYTLGGAPGAVVNASGALSFSPRQETWGARLDLLQDIHFSKAKFFIAASLPIAHVKRSMRIKTTDGTPTRAIGGTEYTLEDFFAGNYENTAEPRNLQSKLTHAKIAKHHSETGVAELDLQLGWKAFCSKKHHLFINFGVAVPTSNKSNGEYLFAPIYGNGDHVGVGAGIDAGATLWNNDKNKIRLLAAGNYRFLFDNTQKRTIGLKDEDGKALPFVHYQAGFKLDQPANSPLFPLANELTRDVRVEPGSQIDALLALACSCGSVTFDAGYNIFWREKESIKLKKSWEDGIIYLSDPTRRTDQAFDLASLVGKNDAEITADALDMNSATTPSLLSHKIFAGLAYTGKIKEAYPFSLGLGGSYEFADSNADLENWSVWIKAIFSF